MIIGEENEEKKKAKKQKVHGSQRVFCESFFFRRPVGGVGDVKANIERA